MFDLWLYVHMHSAIWFASNELARCMMVMDILLLKTAIIREVVLFVVES
jgi:hypothetical protein